MYELHVALRHTGTELPGSPFQLKVTAGAACALSTSMPLACLPLSGMACEVTGMNASDRDDEDIAGRMERANTVSAPRLEGRRNAISGSTKQKQAKKREGCVVFLSVRDKAGK